MSIRLYIKPKGRFSIPTGNRQTRHWHVPENREEHFEAIKWLEINQTNWKIQCDTQLDVHWNFRGFYLLHVNYFIKYGFIHMKQLVKTEIGVFITFFFFLSNRIMDDMSRWKNNSYLWLNIKEKSHIHFKLGYELRYICFCFNKRL